MGCMDDGKHVRHSAARDNNIISREGEKVTLLCKKIARLSVPSVSTFRSLHGREEKETLYLK